MRKHFQSVSIIAIFSLVSPFALSFYAFAATSDVTRIQTFMLQIVQIVAGFSAIIATGFLVYGGILMSTSSGHPEKLERSKKTLLYSIIGLAVTILAFVIINAVSQVANQAAGN